jgi:hypothetical protein
MIIKNKITGKTFNTTMDYWENNLVAKGLSEKYEIVEDDAPIEIKQLSIEIKKQKKK